MVKPLPPQYRPSAKGVIEDAVGPKLEGAGKINNFRSSTRS